MHISRDLERDLERKQNVKREIARRGRILESGHAYFMCRLRRYDGCMSYRVSADTALNLTIVDDCPGKSPRNDRSARCR